MRLGGDPVGRWGLALLGVTGVAGVFLAMHGWAGRTSAVGPASLGAGSGSAGSGQVSSPSPVPSASQATTSPSSPSARANPSASASASAGPLLRAEPYASYAYKIWPGQPSAVARQALTGLSISVHKQRTGLAVTAGVTGQAASAPHLYTGGVRVYVVEASMGDDSGNSDYNLGDDGLVITDAKGRIVR